MIPQFPKWLYGMSKCWNQEGNYGGGDIFVGVAPFTIITTNLGGSVAVLHHYGLGPPHDYRGQGMETGYTTTQDTLFVL